MSPLLQKPLITAAFFIILFLTGFWTGRTGKPVNPIRMTVHKFIALGAAVFVGDAIFRLSPASAWTGTETGVVIASGVIAVTAIITGGLASLARPFPAATAIHKVTPYLALLSTAATLYLLGI
ncbi:MAG: hypothetical protein AB1846_12230 [Chloroflexota bacterium]